MKLNHDFQYTICMCTDFVFLFKSQYLLDLPTKLHTQQFFQRLQKHFFKFSKWRRASIFLQRHFPALGNDLSEANFYSQVFSRTTKTNAFSNGNCDTGTDTEFLCSVVTDNVDSVVFFFCVLFFPSFLRPGSWIFVIFSEDLVETAGTL